MTESEILLGLPHYQIIEKSRKNGKIILSVRYSGPKSCAHCQSSHVRSKGLYRRTIRHEDWGMRHCLLEIEAQKLLCLDCGRQARQRLPGILPSRRASQAFELDIFYQHLDGINRSRLGRRENIGAATVERYFLRGLRLVFGEWHPPTCPTVLGIDEHFFTRKKGYATTLCDLRNHKVYDVVLGRSELSLQAYLQTLQGKNAVRVVCMDLSRTYRSIVRQHFPNAIIVADRFHVIRLINQHFLACWRDVDPAGAKNRGLLSLMRRHRHNLKPDQQAKLSRYFADWPAIEQIYRFKQRLVYLLLKKNRTRKQCQRLVGRLLSAIDQLRQIPFPQLATLGETLFSWRAELVAMWRFTRNNGITEGFHNKMELISRQAYGFRNFENYRMRVKVLCA